MKRIAIFLIAFALLTACKVRYNDNASASTPVDAGNVEQQEIVEKAALAFLEQLDAGEVDGTWANASPHLHNLSNRVVWSTGLSAFRQSVGKFEERKLKGFGFTHEVEDVPKGEYAAVGFDTKFSNTSVEEKVVLHNDQGKWKVMGYFLSKNLMNKS